MNREDKQKAIESLKRNIKTNKAFIKQYKQEIKQLEYSEIINTVSIEEGDYTEAQLKDALLMFNN